MSRRLNFVFNADKISIDLKRVYPESGEVLSVASDYLLEKTRERFKTQVDPNKKPWAPHARDYGNPILYRTGKLFRSIYLNKRNPKRHHLRWNRSQAPYGIYHMEGTRYMPARPFIGINKGDKIEIGRRIEALFRSRAGS